MLNQQFFRQMLAEMDTTDAAVLAQHSKLNHHVNGMHYLCLHRSAKLTVKLYLLEEPTNPNSGFLVHPHSHRYSFGSVVLRGHLFHIRFKAAPMRNGPWSRHTYNAETKSLAWARDVYLKEKVEHHATGSSYWVEPDEIHTLQMPVGPNQGPVLIGLVQLGDVRLSSSLYLPRRKADPKWSDERVPTLAETLALRERCAQLIGLDL